MKGKKVKIIAAVASGLIDIALFIALLLTHTGDFLPALLTAIIAEVMLFISIETDNQQKRCTAYTLGTITGVKHVRVGKVMGYVPTVSYTVNGVEYSGDYSFARQSKNYYKIGDEFWVMYNPENPGEFTQEDGDIDSFAKIFRIVSFVIGGISMILTAVALLSV